MNLVIDLDSEGFVTSSAYSSNYLTTVGSVSARRREIFPLTIQFSKNGALTDIPFTATLTAAVKDAGKYGESTPLAEALTFTKTGTGASAVYSAALSLFTSPIETAFAAVSGVEPTSIETILEVQWANSSETHISQALPLTIANCVYRATDATPETSSPAPVPVSIGTTTTGAAGSSASVTNAGTSSAAVLNFTIPKGDAGTNGTNGKTVWNGSGAPSSVSGAQNGDFYVDVSAHAIYGPVSISGGTQTWGSATSLVGPAGASGAPTITNIALTGDTTLSAPSGTPTDGERVIYRITQDSSGGHAVTIGSGIIVPSGSTAPSFGTAANNVDLLGLMYSAPSSHWIVVSFLSGC